MIKRSVTEWETDRLPSGTVVYWLRKGKSPSQIRTVAFIEKTYAGHVGHGLVDRKGGLHQYVGDGYTVQATYKKYKFPKREIAKLKKKLEMVA